MKVLVDAFGGDHAPIEIIKGCLMAVSECDVDIVLCGDESVLRAVAKENDFSLERFEILNADGVISMHDSPNAILREKKGSSMAVGLQALHDGVGDAFVTAGSTGAALMGATFLVKRIRGIKRAALATLMPTNVGGQVMVLDVGANADCRPEMLYQFAVMGNEYMKNILHLDRPRVALLNNGSEETKGGELQQATFGLLKESPIHFVGNVEARDVLTGEYDVVVCDGFSGNVLLKATEGTAVMMMGHLKAIFKKSLVSKLAASLVMSGLKDLKKKLDYAEIGGAPLIGVTKPVIKAHGSSKAVAIKNAIKQASDFAQAGVVEKISEAISKETITDE